ncbi:MAG: SulP family inorganic anion transporter [Jiangellaceae bacterium]
MRRRSATCHGGFPHWRFPGIPAHLWPGVLAAAAGICVVAFTDNILTARSFSAGRGERIDANQELLALAGANAAAGVLGGFPVSSSGSRTALATNSPATDPTRPALRPRPCDAIHRPWTASWARAMRANSSATLRPTATAMPTSRSNRTTPANDTAAMTASLRRKAAIRRTSVMWMRRAAAYTTRPASAATGNDSSTTPPASNTTATTGRLIRQTQ